MVTETCLDICTDALDTFMPRRLDGDGNILYEIDGTVPMFDGKAKSGNIEYTATTFRKFLCGIQVKTVEGWEKTPLFFSISKGAEADTTFFQFFDIFEREAYNVIKALPIILSKVGFSEEFFFTPNAAERSCHAEWDEENCIYKDQEQALNEESENQMTIDIPNWNEFIAQKEAENRAQSAGQASEQVINPQYAKVLGRVQRGDDETATVAPRSSALAPRGILKKRQQVNFVSPDRADTIQVSQPDSTDAASEFSDLSVDRTEGRSVGSAGTLATLGTIATEKTGTEEIRKLTMANVQKDEQIAELLKAQNAQAQENANLTDRLQLMEQKLAQLFQNGQNPGPQGGQDG